MSVRSDLQRKENGTVCFHAIYQVKVYVDLLYKLIYFIFITSFHNEMATMNLIYECIIVVLTS